MHQMQEDGVGEISGNGSEVEMQKIDEALREIREKKAQLQKELAALQEAERALLPLSSAAHTTAREVPQGKQPPKGMGRLSQFHITLEKILRSRPDEWFTAGKLRELALEENPSLIISDVSAYLSPSNTMNLTWLRRRKTRTVNDFSLDPSAGGTAASFQKEDGVGREIPQSPQSN